MSGPCAKRRVQCLIFPVGQAPIYGENDCENPQDVCPRVPGEGYEKCKTICRQSGHAEMVALQRALEWGANIRGGRAVINGHYWICEPCGKALRDAGITNVQIVDE